MKIVVSNASKEKIINLKLRYSKYLKKNNSKLRYDRFPIDFGIVPVK